MEKPVGRTGRAASPFALADSQLVIASEYGFAAWPKLQAHVKKLEAASSTAEVVASLRDAAGRGDLARLNARKGSIAKIGFASWRATVAVATGCRLRST
jgi:hypothetical protein